MFSLLSPFYSLENPPAHGILLPTFEVGFFLLLNFYKSTLIDTGSELLS